MSDDAVGNVKVRDRYYGLLVIIAFAFLVLAGLVGWFYYHDGFDKGSASCPIVLNNVSGYQAGYVAGTDYGVNVSILSMLHYAQNCSVVRINYSNNIYGFIDATCVIPVNRTVG